MQVMLNNLLFPLSWGAEENTEFQGAQNLRFIFSFQGYYLLQLPKSKDFQFLSVQG